jgi:hypothetical protein
MYSFYDNHQWFMTLISVLSIGMVIALMKHDER